jgi:ABC-2 type transport system ATP-binding protein
VNPTDPSRMVLVAEHLSKWYGDVSGLNDVTVAIPYGITGLLGPNGAGKSTFMKLATGQLLPSAGTIRVFGQPIWGNPGLYARIGVCPDQDAFYDWMTGRQWLETLVRLNGLSQPAARAAAARALEAADLGEVADRRIASYSKGMRQRAKLAQAIVHDPELLILDEPLNGMDPLMRRRTIGRIKEWARAGKSVLVSSHILHEVEAMTSNILLVNNGRILAEGNVHQIRELIDEHPHTVFIRTTDPRGLAQHLMAQDDVLSVTFEEGALVVQTAKPDVFYTRLTTLAASREAGTIDEITSPDDNLQAVFKYLVKS